MKDEDSEFAIEVVVVVVVVVVIGAAVVVDVDEDVEVVWVAEPLLICKFFFAISAFNTVPFSWSIFLPLKTSIASSASKRVRNLANPI